MCIGRMLVDMSFSEKVGPEEDAAADEAEDLAEAFDDDGCVGDEDSGALGFGGYGERGDDWEVEELWGIDGMGPDGE